jgi:hypothetical protein
MHERLHINGHGVRKTTDAHRPPLNTKVLLNAALGLALLVVFVVTAAFWLGFAYGALRAGVALGERMVMP